MQDFDDKAGSEQFQMVEGLFPCCHQLLWTQSSKAGGAHSLVDDILRIYSENDTSKIRFGRTIRLAAVR